MGKVTNSEDGQGAKGLERQLLGSFCHTEEFPHNVLESSLPSDFSKSTTF